MCVKESLWKDSRVNETAMNYISAMNVMTKLYMNRINYIECLNRRTLCISVLICIILKLCCFVKVFVMQMCYNKLLYGYNNNTEAFRFCIVCTYFFRSENCFYLKVFLLVIDFIIGEEGSLFFSKKC